MSVATMYECDYDNTSCDYDKMDWKENITHAVVMRRIFAVTNVFVSMGIISSFILIMLVIYRQFQRGMQKPSNHFILSMCITDFLVTLILAPHFIFVSTTGDTWPSSYIHCKVLAFLNTLLPGMSILNLILIAVDRMVAIFKPTKYRIWLCNRNSRILCACFWCYSCVIASFTFWDSFSKPLFDGGIMTCLLTGRNFLLLQLFCEVIPGLAITVTCYTYIVIKLMKRSANIYTTSKASKVNYEIRMAKIGGLVSGFFITTYLPYYTIMFTSRETMEPIVKMMAGIMVVSSYNFDAFMYGYCNKNYRREIKKFMQSKVPWLIKITPAESTDTNQDTMYTNTVAQVAPNHIKKPRVSLAPITIKEEQEQAGSTSIVSSSSH